MLAQSAQILSKFSEQRDKTNRRRESAHLPLDCVHVAFFVAQSLMFECQTQVLLDELGEDPSTDEPEENDVPSFTITFYTT
jgi:hypothetical protein